MRVYYTKWMGTWRRLTDLTVNELAFLIDYVNRGMCTWTDDVPDGANCSKEEWMDQARLILEARQANIVF